MAATFGKYPSLDKQWRKMMFPFYPYLSTKNRNATQEEWKSRRLIWDFKDGKAFALTTLIFHMLHVPVWYECLLQPHCSPDDEVPEGTSYSRHPVPFAESVLFSFILFLLPFLSRVFPKASCFPRFCCPYPIWEPLFFDGKFIRVSGNERVPAMSLCPEKNNDDGLSLSQHFFRSKLF